MELSVSECQLDNPSCNMLDSLETDLHADLGDCVTLDLGGVDGVEPVELDKDTIAKSVTEQDKGTILCLLALYHTILCLILYQTTKF